MTLTFILALVVIRYADFVGTNFAQRVMVFVQLVDRLIAKIQRTSNHSPLRNWPKSKRKSDKRTRQKKQKISENRKHLANVRVVQKNLVFVVGLSPRLADAEVLRKPEYFGKFGKMHKVVINLSTAYAGNQNQGPSASAYVTYYRSEDALRAIQAVSNIFIDGRTLKASLGTTK